MAWVVRRFVVFAFAVALLRLDVFAQDKRFTYGAESDVSSKYVWRGMVLDERPVTENSAWLEAFGVNLTLWANAALPYAADRSRLRV